MSTHVPGGPAARALTARIGAREAVGRMSPGELILVSVDDHVVEPPDLFHRHLAAQWRARAPKMVKNR